MSVSMGAAGESAAAIATLLKHSPTQCASGLTTQDQVGPFAARAEGEAATASLYCSNFGHCGTGIGTPGNAQRRQAE
jgi:hypothetical protein